MPVRNSINVIACEHFRFKLHIWQSVKNIAFRILFSPSFGVLAQNSKTCAVFIQLDKKLYEILKKTIDSKKY